MKKILLLLCSITLLITLTACSKSNESLEVSKMSDYVYMESQDKIATFYVLNSQSLKNKIDNNDTFLMLLAYPSCSWCQKGMPSFNKFALKNDIPLYYFNVTGIDEETFNYISSLLNDVLLEIYGDSSLYTPMLVGFKNGNPVSAYYGGIDDSGDVYSEAEIDLLSSEYETVLNAIK